MPVTSYTGYLRDLKNIIDKIRDRPFEYEAALIRMAICKNGYGYKSRDLISSGKLYSEHDIGLLTIQRWGP